MKIEFFKHNLGSKEKDSLLECLDGIFLTTGSYVADFEKKLSEYLDVSQVIGLTSCTAALHLALLALDIGPEDEVITTPLTFIATANAILYTGAKPVFVDVDPNTGLIDLDKVNSAVNSKTKAVLPVHLYGQMCDMIALTRLAEKHDLKVIEDAAHCIEGTKNNIRPGMLSDAACFSFYATKNITCGEGGAVATRHADVADKIRSLRSHGMTKNAADRYVGKYQHWDMTMLGWKYNMANISASLLGNQLKHIEEYRLRREEICLRYEKAFQSNPNIQLLKNTSGSKSARHLFTILVPKEKRDEILWKLQEKEIGVAVNYRAVHLLSYYQQLGFKRGMFPIAEDIGDRTITLPLYTKLTDEEIAYVITSVNEAVK